MFLNLTNHYKKSANAEFKHQSASLKNGAARLATRYAYMKRWYISKQPPRLTEKKMADQVLKDNKGHTIGKISTASNGVQTIKDENGHTVGTGNLLTRLL